MTNGSLGLTPNSSDERYRDAADVPMTPSPAPIATEERPAPRIRRAICPRVAPSATRTPISRVRSDTDCANTPYSPIAASTRLAAANIDSIHSVARRRNTAEESPAICSIVRTANIGRSASSLLTTCRAVVTAAPVSAARIMTVYDPVVSCAIAKYTTGNSGRSTSSNRSLSTTPTISQLPGRNSNEMRWPSGSVPANCVSASRRLTTTTCGDDALSVNPKLRPRTSGTRIAEK